MRLRTFEIDDLARMAPRDYVEHSTPVTSTMMAIDTGLSQTVLCGKEVLACGGVMRIGASHIGTAWVYVSRDLSRCHLRYFLLACRLMLARSFHQLKLRRIQASVYEADEKSVRFIEYLGFCREGTMRQFGPEGQTAYLYAHYRD